MRSLVADLNGNMRVKDNIIEDSKTRTEYNGAVVGIPFNTTKRVVFNNDSIFPNEDINDNYNTTTGIYKAPSNGDYNINIIFKNTLSSSPDTENLIVY